MPRAWSRSPSAAVASWLLAAPATARHAKGGDRLGGEHGPGRAGGEHVARRLQRGLDRHGLGAGRGHLRRVDIAGEHAGARLAELLDQPAAHRAGALHQHGAGREVVGTERVPARGADRVEHPDRGALTGVARAAVVRRTPEHVTGALGDQVHLGRPGVHVGRGDVRAVQRLDEVRVAKHDRASLLGSSRRHGGHRQHRLATAVGKPGRGLLHAHRSGQTQRIGDGLVGSRIRLHARAAHRRAEHRRMDADEHPGAGGLVEVCDELLTVPALQPFLEHDRKSRTSPRPAGTQEAGSEDPASAVPRAG